MAKKDSKRVMEIREKATLQRREQQRAQKRKTTVMQVGIILGIVVIVAAVVVGMMLAQSNKAPAVAPTGSSSITVLGTHGIPLVVKDHAVSIGFADAPVKIDVYEDYSCPHCAEYEAGVGQTMLSLVASGDAVFTFHPMAFVTPYGTAAGSAAACIAAKDPEHWPTFHSALFANHNKLTDGWAATDFADLARSQGVIDKGTLKCITSQSYVDWMGESTSAAGAAGVTATPTMFINGKKQTSLLGPDDLVAAVKHAKGN